MSLDDAIGAGRADIEQRVQQSMQQVLDDYGSGVEVQGVAINQSGPPERVNEAFLEVSAAQQRAQSAMNNARSYALQLTARAQGEAAAFDKVYAEYRLAPEVTRRRMYYETMEQRPPACRYHHRRGAGLVTPIWLCPRSSAERFAGSRAPKERPRNPPPRPPAPRLRLPSPPPLRLRVLRKPRRLASPARAR